VEYLVAQNFFEDRARRRIVSDNVPIDGEAVRRCLFRQMQKREERLVRFVVNVQVINAVTVRRNPAGRRVKRRSPDS